MNKQRSGRLQPVRVPAPTAGPAVPVTAPRAEASRVQVSASTLEGEGSITVRRISNGYVVRETSYSGDRLHERETFTPTRPAIEVKK